MGRYTENAFLLSFEFVHQGVIFVEDGEVVGERLLDGEDAVSQRLEREVVQL